MEISIKVPKYVIDKSFQIKWELKGLNTFFIDDPFHFSLDVRGSIYPERRGKHSWLKNQIEMKISFILSPAMVFVPQHVLQDAIELVRMLFLSSYIFNTYVNIQIQLLFKFYNITYKNNP
jgi:hypothetical protein